MTARTATGLVFAVLAAGCKPEPSDPTESGVEDTDTVTDAHDADLDGWTVEGGDCDDANPEVFPSAREVCNGRDDDCDGVVDSADPDLIPGYVDADGDGWGTDVRDRSCTGADQPGDCDDADATRFPGAPEIACDGLDQNCVDDDDDIATTDGVPQPSVNAALRAAGPASEVVICPGTHVIQDGGDFWDGDADGLVIRGGSGDPADTVLTRDASDWMYAVLDLRGPGNITVSGLTLTAPTSDSSDHSVNSVCLELSSFGAAVHVTDVILTACEGGGAMIGGAAVRFEGVTVEDAWSSYVSTHGGGLTLVSPDIEVVRSTFDGNTSADPELGGGVGGALWVGLHQALTTSTTFRLVVRDSSFVGNTAGYVGGGVNVDVRGPSTGTATADITFEDVVFERNRASNSGGAIAAAFTYFDGVANLSLTDVSVVDSGAGDNDPDAGTGGGLYVTGLDDADEATITLERVSITDSVAAIGAAMYITAPAVLDVHDVSLADNISRVGVARPIVVLSRTHGVTGPIMSTWDDVEIYRNSGGLDLDLGSGNTVDLRDVDFGTGADVNGGADVRECPTARLGYVTAATLDDATVCP